MPLTEYGIKTFLSLGLVASSVWVTSTGFCDDDKAACADAALKGQTLRDEHKLLEAREAFRFCARAACPKAVRGDCATWLDAVEPNVPTVVVTAKNRAGASLIDVRVTVDGRPLTDKLDGDAVPMNPGTHAFHFETADGSTLDQRVVIAEGQQSQPISVVLGPLPSAEPAPIADVPRKPVAGRSGELNRVGWVVGALGVAGLGLGASFGIVAIIDKKDAHCDGNDFCDPGPLSSAKHAAVASNVGLIAGGVLLGAGAALVLFAPHGREGVTVNVTPSVGAGGVVAVHGAW
jgi:hypothetical protein